MNQAIILHIFCEIMLQYFYIFLTHYIIAHSDLKNGLTFLTKSFKQKPSWEIFEVKVDLSNAEATFVESKCRHLETI